MTKTFRIKEQLYIYTKAEMGATMQISISNPAFDNNLQLNIK